MRISELANTVSVNIQTVRFYEREGLLNKPARTSSGYRDYDQNALNRLQFICHAKEIGFTLREIRELMGLDVEGPQSCGCVQKVVEKKLCDLEQKLKAMRHMKKILQRLHECCTESSASAPCPVLEHLSS